MTQCPQFPEPEAGRAAGETGEAPAALQPRLSHSAPGPVALGWNRCFLVPRCCSRCQWHALSACRACTTGASPPQPLGTAGTKMCRLQLRGGERMEQSPANPLQTERGSATSV